MEKLHGREAPKISERVVACVGRYYGIVRRNGGRSEEACAAGHSGSGQLCGRRGDDPKTQPALPPNTGPCDGEVITAAVSALFNKIGPGILVTHSQSGGPGWVTAIKNRNVRAIVAYEPGSGFIFPEGEVPAPMPSAMGPLEGAAVP